VERLKKKAKGVLSRLLDALGSYIDTWVKDLLKLIKYLRHPVMRKKIMDNVWNFLVLFYRRIVSEGIMKEAGALTYITMLSFIPFLMFIFFIIPDLPFLNMQEKIASLVEKTFIPESATQVNLFVQETLNRRSTFNILNFLILSITSYALFKVIRDTFDRILSMDYRPKQDIVSQLIKFLGTIIFGMVIILLLFSSSSIPVISVVMDIPVLKQLLVQIIPFVTQFIALIFLYMILPSIRMKRSALFRSAFWTTLIWVIVKSGFDFYIFHLTNIEAVYGVLASLPIFLMWIYLNWLIILGGIVLASVLDQKDKIVLSAKTPRQIVKLTVEMYSDNQINQRLEQYLKKKDLNEMINYLEQEEEK